MPPPEVYRRNVSIMGGCGKAKTMKNYIPPPVQLCTLNMPVS